MKSFLSLLLLSCAAAAAASPADETPFAGKWQVYMDVAGTNAENLCTFTQTDGKLAGSCETRNGTVEISAGKADQKNVTWTYVSRSDQGTYTVVFTGVLEAAKIKGSVNVEEVGVQGTFTANQAK